MLKIPMFVTAIAALGCLAFQSCATESHRTMPTEAVASHGTPYSGPKYTLAVGKFNNASPYMHGIFSEGTDQLGNQAKTILETDLSQSGRFTVVNRENMEEIAKESQISGAQQKLTGAEVVLTGEVTEFGRKVTGDQELFGILGKAKQQVAYSKVSINVVDVKTSQIVYSVQGAGEYALSDREIIGFGSTSGYDSTLNGKVLNLSITDAVNKLVTALENGQWSPTEGAAKKP
jgi:curli biogenesis system outer membrane secretion channel CsgG